MNAYLISFSLTEDDVTIRAGTSYQGDAGVVVRVSKIIIHESFNLHESYDYDIAVLELSENLDLGPNVQTIGNKRKKLFKNWRLLLYNF